MAIKKLLAWIKPTVRKVKTKSGAVKKVAVKSHYNKINRKPRKSR